MHTMISNTKKKRFLCRFGVCVGCGIVAFLWLVWPNLMEINQALLCFSGEHCSVVFTCVSERCATFELCFDDESYEPTFSGTLRLHKDDTLLHEFGITGFHITNGFRGGKQVGKKRYAIEIQSTSGISLEDMMEAGKNFRAEFNFSSTIPKAMLLYSCVEFKSDLEHLLELLNGTRSRKGLISEISADKDA